MFPRRRRAPGTARPLSSGGDLTAYEELRAGFTAAGSHELRTPLARLLSLLETAMLPGEDVADLVDRARAEVEQIRELIDEVLFLSELESGTRVVSLGLRWRSRPELDVVATELEERAGRAGVALRGRERRSDDRARGPAADDPRRRPEPGGERDPLRGPRRDVHAGGRADGGHDRPARHRRRRGGREEAQLTRLFERFFPGDRARASRGTGLGLAMVDGASSPQAGGSVEARGGLGAGLEIRCVFQARIAADVHRFLTRRSPDGVPPAERRHVTLASMSETATEASVSTGIDPSKIGQLASQVGAGDRGA